MAVSSNLGEKQLQTIFSDYDLGEVCGYWPASSGGQNTNLYITTSTQNKKTRRTLAFPDTQNFVLTLLDNNNCLNPLLSPILTRCSKAGLPAARLVANKSGSFHGVFQNRPVFVCTRLQGRHVFNPTRNQCAAIGRFLARFHIANSSLQAEPHPCNAEWLEHQRLRIQGYISHSEADLLRDASSGIGAMLRRNDVQNLPAGVIHADLRRDNALFNERGLSGALDFCQAAQGFWLFDLAVAVNDWCLDDEDKPDRAKLLALVSAYKQIRQLTREEVWYFDLFALYAAVCCWLNRINLAIRPHNASTPFKCPPGFHRIATLHHSPSFGLSELLSNNPGA